MIVAPFVAPALAGAARLGNESAGNMAAPACAGATE
jgi:hypothetical protein